MVFLIAEDNARMRDSIKRYLNSKIPGHHTIHEGVDGSEAIAIYKRVHPDWVLMDIAMEPMDGFDAARAILAEDPEAKIIILTNFDEVRYRDAAKDLGAKAFVLKEHLSDVLSILLPQVSRGSS